MNAMDNNIIAYMYKLYMLTLLAGSYDYAFGLCKLDFILLHI